MESQLGRKYCDTLPPIALFLIILFYCFCIISQWDRSADKSSSRWSSSKCLLALALHDSNSFKTLCFVSFGSRGID